MTELTFGEALNRAIAAEMERDSRVIYLATSPPKALERDHGSARVRRTPIAESAMTGMAVGAAGSGYRPIVHWGCVTFSFVAFDQIANQAGRIRYMFGGQRSFPIVFIAQYLNGSRSAAQHSQTGFSLYAHAAGLKVVAPSTPADVDGLLRSAVRDDNPVVLVHSERLVPIRGEVPGDGPTIPFGAADLRTSGTDVTIVGIGYMAQVAVEAARRLAADGIQAEVIDPRTLVPLDIDTIRQSVRRTGRLVVVDESYPTCSMAAEISAAVGEDPATFGALRAPIQRVCTAPLPVPFSPPLEDIVLPDADDVAAAAISTIRWRTS